MKAKEPRPNDLKNIQKGPNKSFECPQNTTLVRT
jgi:hypothetical protein